MTKFCERRHRNILKDRNSHNNTYEAMTTQRAFFVYHMYINEYYSKSRLEVT